MRFSGADLVLVAGAATDAREAYVAALEAAGLRVTTTGDGIGALVKAVALLPKLVVMDAEMPSLSGLEVAARLQEYSTTRRIPAVLIGAAAARAWTATGILLPKGIPPADLVAVVLARLRG